MKILKTITGESQAKYKIDEYTSEFGSIIFDGSKGGSISNCYFFRLNKTIDVIRNSDGEMISSKGSFIDFYISKKEKKIQHIDFVALSHFELQFDKTLSFQECRESSEHVIDISTWVSGYGRMKGLSYDESKYLVTEHQVDVKIVSNGIDVVKFVFGNCDRIVCYNSSLQFNADAYGNLSEIVIKDDASVSNLIKKLQKSLD